MIHNLKPYANYKDSGVPWLGKVPEHWEVRRGKWLFRHEKLINTDRVSSNVLSLTLRGVVNNDPDNPEGLVPKDYGTYQLFRRGDLVFKLIDLENLRTSRVGLVHEDGIMSSAYVRLIPRSVGDIGFFFRQYFDLYERGIYNQLGAGVRSTLGPSDLLNLNVVVPPFEEQSAIVRYLDYMDRRIRRYIRAKQNLIKLLTEQKQAIIHKAVTRGLGPSVPLKLSGVEWLGSIPEHWEIMPLRRRWSITDCKHLTVPFQDEGIPLASIREVQYFDLTLKTAKRTSQEWYEKLIEGDRAPEQGDVIYCRNVSVGSAGYVNTDQPFAMGQDVCLIRSKNQNQRYLNYFFHSAGMNRQLASLLIGSTFNRINVEEIKALVVVVPPVTEQDAIAQYLDRALLHSENTIANALREISLLREYHTRLISDVVTGKLDVREAEARLPEEADGQELIEEAEALIDDNGVPEGTDPDELIEEAEG